MKRAYIWLHPGAAGGPPKHWWHNLGPGAHALLTKEGLLVLKLTYPP